LVHREHGSAFRPDRRPGILDLDELQHQAKAHPDFKGKGDEPLSTRWIDEGIWHLERCHAVKQRKGEGADFKWPLSSGRFGLNKALASNVTLRDDHKNSFSTEKEALWLDLADVARYT
jgi:hypothetical protein